MRTRIVGALLTAAVITATGVSGAGAVTATAEPTPAGPAHLVARCAEPAQHEDCVGGRLDHHHDGGPAQDTVESRSDAAGHRISAAHHWTPGSPG
jgi:hypothetical protein